MTLDFQKCRSLLQEFNFSDLFVEQLGWSFPSTIKAVPMEIEGETYYRQALAELSGVYVFSITAQNGGIPNPKTRAAISKEIAHLAWENLLIFLDDNKAATQSLWYWVKREGSKTYPREHFYVKRQAGDLLLSKISALKVDFAELESGDLSVIDIAQRLQTGFDVDRVTKRFFEEFKQQHAEFLSVIQGIDNEADRRWYTSVILNRLMFVYFLQRKGFIDNGNTLYLQSKLDWSQQRGADLFYNEFLQALFFEGFAQPSEERSPETRALIGEVKYLNGGLFLKHKIEQKYSNIVIADNAFEKIFDLFARYSWNLDDTPEGKDNEINPAVLGYIFEKYINQKAFGAYYTRPEITEYLCASTINKLILSRINPPVSRQSLEKGGSQAEPGNQLTEALAPHPPNPPLLLGGDGGAGGLPQRGAGGGSPRHFESINELLMRLDADLCRRLLYDILPSLSILDPACGSGAFLIAAMKTLIYIYSAVMGRIEFLTDTSLKTKLQKEISAYASLQYFIKKRIITNNLYGVDIMEEATEIAKLRLFLELISSANDVCELEPLPNIDFNIMAGNSLIGLMQVNEADYQGHRAQGNLFRKTYREVLEEKNRLIATYRNASSYYENLQSLRNNIDARKAEALETLDEVLLEDFQALKIKFEQAQLEGKPKKRSLAVADIKALKPFHWGYEFDYILQQRGGFDAIVTNPPWEIFKPDAKEFFAQHSDLVTKKKMEIKAFEKEQEKLLKEPEVSAAWLEYQSQFPYVSVYYRSSLQYENQISIVNGKKAGTDINLYKLFLEQCFNLLRLGGECGIVIPSGIYTDLGTKQLREMLFSQTQVTGLFCFENRKTIFEGVHRSFKFVVLTFEKGGTTENFPAAFMRHDVQELQRFPSNNFDEQVEISVRMVRRLSPDSLSVMEFKNSADIRIAEKMTKFPLLGEKIEGKWNLQLTAEFHMTNDSKLFKPQIKGRLPLYEGKMIHQFTHLYAAPRYWVDEQEGRKALLGRNKTDNGQKLDYQGYRFAYRSIGRSTDSRTLIGTLLPPKVFSGNSINVVSPTQENKSTLFICAVLNSLCLDFALRQQVSANLNMFYVYQTPVPRTMEGDRFFNDIVTSAAKLICTTPEFDELAREVGLGSHENGVRDERVRAQLRAELDGIIAHLYGLTEEEFAYILTTFPIVADSVKQAALEAYRTYVAPMA